MLGPEMDFLQETNRPCKQIGSSYVTQYSKMLTGPEPVDVFDDAVLNLRS
jgi:hypothetical protein